MKRVLAACAGLLCACLPPTPHQDPFAGLDLAPPAPVAAVAPAKVYRSDVDEPAYKLAEREDDLAIVVGVERYEGLPAADFAERDARAVKAHLLALGYPERNVVLLTGRSAGRAAIEKYVEAWLPQAAKPQSRVLFYFSGHGAPDVGTGSAYLLPWDGDPKFLANTAYPVKRLYEKLNAVKAKQVLVAMDSCFSGAGGRSVIPKGTRPLVSQLKKEEDSIGKLVVLAASASDEITGSDETQGHGLFTYHLLKGLAERGGRASARELHQYLTPRVRDAARADNRDQTPQLLGAAADAGL